METAIADLILEYRDEDIQSDCDNKNEDINQAITRQRNIGQFPVMCGFLCSDWV